MKIQKIVSITSSAEVISEISRLKTDELQLSESVQLTSPSDVLDAPLNPDDVIQGVEMIKVMFEAGTAIVAFSSALISLLKEKKAKAKINSAEEETVIDGDTSVKELQRILSK